MSKITEKDLEQGRKFYRLWKSATIPGEKAAARRKLDGFLSKFGLTEGDIDPEANTRTIRPERVDELDLLLTIIVSVNPNTRYTTDKKTLDVKCELDDEDYKEVLNKYAYFVKMWRVEKELLKTAFHLKHKKFFKADEYASKKWRPRNVQNESIQTAQNDKEEANIEWQKMSQAVNSGRVSEAKLMKDVLNSQDKIKVMAFNAGRADLLEQILLPADYLKNNKTIEDGNRGH